MKELNLAEVNAVSGGDVSGAAVLVGIIEGAVIGGIGAGIVGAVAGAVVGGVSAAITGALT